MGFDVITFGSAVVDVFVDTDVSEKKNFISYPVGSKILIKDLKIDVGGGGTNCGVAFSRLGLKTGYIGKLGDDENGKRVLDLLKKEKIKFLGKMNKDNITGQSIILDSKEKSRTILTYKGINDTIGLEDIQLEKLKTKWIYLTSLLGKSFETQKKIVSKLSQKGAKIAFNPSEYLIKRKNLSGILKVCDVLILNKEEGMLLVGKKGGLLEKLHELGPKIVVVTDKNNLISCYNGIKKYYLKPNKVRVVERTGAGDAFASGFVAGLIANKTIEESLKLGLKEGESVIRYFGAKNKLLRMNIK